MCTSGGPEVVLTEPNLSASCDIRAVIRYDEVTLVSAVPFTLPVVWASSWKTTQVAVWSPSLVQPYSVGV